MRRRRFLVGAGSTVVLVLTSCGSDDDAADPATDETAGGDATTTRPPQGGSTEADAELIDVAIGGWEALSPYGNTSYAVDVGADGTFTIRSFELDEPEEGPGPEGSGTWEIDDGTLTIDVDLPSRNDGSLRRLRCVLEGAAVGSTILRMVAYTKDGEDELDPDGIRVRLEWQGSELVIRGNDWQCIPDRDAPEIDGADLVGTWEAMGDDGPGCSSDPSQELELSVASFRTITFTSSRRFEGDLRCGGITKGFESDAPTVPETAEGSFTLDEGAVLLTDVSVDGDPLPSDDATFVAAHPSEVELVDAVLYVREPDRPSRVAFDRVE
jgi:hypothetical protein